MNVTLDTNVLIAAFISRGVCHELLEYCARHHRLVTSGFILDEFRDKMLNKFGMDPQDVTEAVDLIRKNADVVHPASIREHVSRDPDDDNILAAAVAGKSACIVTGDKDLLVLKEYAGIDVIEPSAFWKYEALK